MRQYAKLGRAIAQARQQAGLATQRDLAARMSVAQQSVSRWEAGTHRPGLEQIGELSRLLPLNAGDLRLLAGYGAVPAQVSAAPFPVETLGGEEFELFVADVARAYFQGSRVRRVGKSGHRQDGVDLEVLHPDGSRTVIQCKRTARFGPGDVREVAERLEGDSATRKILALGRVASPQAAKEAQSLGLDLWDRDDLSALIRERLDHQLKERLVDTFFRGQREALLGVSEPGPWMSAAEFFAPFQIAARGFSHAWSLVGREHDLDALIAALDAPLGAPVLLVAAAGMGKSRLLAAWAEKVQGQGASLYFLSATADLKRADLLRLGPGPKILVVDDAHDRDGLGALFELAADPTRQVRIVLASRPYAVERIRGELAVSGLGAPTIVTLSDLSQADLTAMTQEVLASFDRPQHWAGAIVQGAGGSPLVALMAARVVAKDAAPMEQARSDAELRALVLKKFARVLVGDFGAGGDDKVISDVLGVLALAQPFHPEDHALLALIEQVTGVGPIAAGRAMRQLLDGGVAYSRGRRWRLMPDVLGDYLIETSCLDMAGKLSPFANAALAAVRDSQLLMTNIMVNLGRLDWRRSNGDTSASDLLAGAWSSLDSIQDEWDTRLNAVKAVAYYQPQQALEFVTRKLRKGRALPGLAEILRNVAVGSGKLEPAAGLLWDMGQMEGGDEVANNPALRTLTELCGYHPHRSLAFPEQSLAFGLSLIERPGAWSGAVTPLDVLAVLLSTEGVTSHTSGLTVSISPYFVDPTAVAQYRQAVIDKILELLRDPRLRVARAAASALQTALRPPIGRVMSAPPPGSMQAYDAEALRILERLEVVMRAGVHPLVAVGIETAIRWRLLGRKDAITKAVQRVMDAIKRDLEFDLRLVIGGEALDIFRHDGQDFDDLQTRFNAWVDKVAADLRAAEPDPEARRARIERLLAEAEQARAPDQIPYRLIYPSLRQDPALAEAFLADALSRGASLTRDHIHLAIATLTFNDKEKARAWARRVIASGDAVLLAGIARGFDGGAAPEAEDIELMACLSGAGDPRVAKAAVQAISWSQLDDRAKLKALLHCQVGANEFVADELASALVGASERQMVDLIEPSGVDQLLAKFVAVPQFNKYWVDKLLAELSERFPHAVADFLQARAEMAASLGSYSFRAANNGPYSHTPLRVVQTPHAREIMAKLWAWLLTNPARGQIFRWAALEVIRALFGADSAFLAKFLEGQLPSADSQALKLASELIRHADHDFVFNQTDFVIAFLERCEAVDLDLLERVISDLSAGATEGIRSGVPGEPYPRDIADRDRAAAMLSRLSRLSPAYELFEDIHRYASDSIKRALRDAEFLEDEP